MKSEIIEIVEVGFPQSLIQREDNPICELIKTEDLVKELHFRLRGELLKKTHGERDDDKERTETHIIDSSKFNKSQFYEDCKYREVDARQYGLDPELMKIQWEQIVNDLDKLKEHIRKRGLSFDGIKKFTKSGLKHHNFNGGYGDEELKRCIYCGTHKSVHDTIYPKNI